MSEISTWQCDGCDASGCVTRVASGAKGWLRVETSAGYSISTKEVRHYCPDCAPYIRQALREAFDSPVAAVVGADGPYR